MISFFVRMEVQRRYFSIVGMEMLSKCFGMKEPSSLEAMISRQSKIPLDRLIKNGRGLTVDQFLEAKKEFWADDKARKQLIQDRETFVVYKDKARNQKGVDAQMDDGDHSPVNVKKGKKSAASKPPQDYGIFASFMDPKPSAKK